MLIVKGGISRNIEGTNLAEYKAKGYTVVGEEIDEDPNNVPKPKPKPKPDPPTEIPPTV